MRAKLYIKFFFDYNLIWNRNYISSLPTLILVQCRHEESFGLQNPQSNSAYSRNRVPFLGMNIFINFTSCLHQLVNCLRRFIKSNVWRNVCVICDKGAKILREGFSCDSERSHFGRILRGKTTNDHMSSLHTSAVAFSWDLSRSNMFMINVGFERTTPSPLMLSKLHHYCQQHSLD